MVGQSGKPGIGRIGNGSASKLADHLATFHGKLSKASSVVSGYPKAVSMWGGYEETLKKAWDPTKSPGAMAEKRTEEKEGYHGSEGYHSLLSSHGWARTGNTPRIGRDRQAEPETMTYRHKAFPGHEISISKATGNWNHWDDGKSLGTGVSRQRLNEHLMG
jgi:hypothetical protein